MGTTNLIETQRFAILDYLNGLKGLGRGIFVADEIPDIIRKDVDLSRQ